MAGYSARQSSFTTGDTITAAHSNDEFNQVLAAFNATTGHTHDGTAGEGGPVGSIRDADSLNKVLVDSTNNHLEFYVEVSSSAVQQLRIQDGAIVPITDNDIDLGTSSLEFKDLFIDGTANIDTLSLDGTAITATGAEINLIDGGATVGTTAVADGDGIIHNDGGTMRVTSATTFKTYFQTGVTAAAIAADDISAGDAAVTLSTSSGNITIDATANDSDIIFKGTDNSADITMLTLDGSEAGKATFNSDVVVGGDLTVTGDDITMGTNTAGMLLVADGTNFNPVAISGDVTMASSGAVTIAATSVENSMLAGSIADSKLSTITTADKVSGAAVQIDGATDGTSITVADADKLLIDDGGTTKYITASQLNTYTSGSVAADNISTGDAAVTIATSSGNITIDAQAGDADIIFKGTDSSSDITALTLDMSAAGAATFNDKIVATELDISGDVDIDGTLEADAITINGTTLAETISDTVGAMVGSNTETGISVTYDDSDNTLDFVISALPLSSIDIDGGTDIGADLTTSDLIVVDDGAGGTNRKAALSRVVTLMTAQGFVTDDPTALAIALG